ncbi:MAG: thioredoxin domain-containing protein [Dehalococcoidia bacterium]
MNQSALKSRWARGLVTAGVLASLAFMAACGGDDDEPPTVAATATPFGVQGTATTKSTIGRKLNEAMVPEAMADGRRLGSADAKVVIEAYEDFGCPHCLDFTAEIEPSILRDYVVTGKVAFEFKFFPLRQLTAGAAIAAACAAEQDKFWPFHRALYIAQAEANAQVGPPLTDAFSAAGLRQIATDVGLDTAAYDACTVSDDALQVVQDELRKANELALPGTPSFVINGEVVAAPLDYAGWKKLLDGLLK